ncbi:hypothetical protein CLIB1444_11S00584 [[Candida] jaroonii]|uniref:Uncharacterized protein n=1 Tax=[Candida] jaroonii TaxID=467808 RepID=A0ACA9YCV1_9ASCO|nr:hypothetical protein CLIB1444_11S00584 [[Candida] jaroonii]
MANVISTSHTKSLFPHPWYIANCDIGPLPLSLDEWEIIEISKAIRSKSGWQIKYKDSEITSKWQSELCSQSKRKEINKLFDFVLKELDWYVEMENSIPGYKIECDDKIVTSDNAVPLAIKEDFIREVKSFSSSLKEKDYHPGSNNQVLDLVHPSLYPYQYGKTPTITDNGIELVPYSDEVKNFKFGVSKYLMSDKYQWLPSLLTLKDGNFSFASYINNLHPKYQGLYKSIESIFNLSIPGLNFILSRTISNQVVRIEVPPGEKAYTDEFNQKVKDLWSDDSLSDEVFMQERDRLEESKIYNLKELKFEYVKPEMAQFDLRDFEDLKVIVKLADIELTPENPYYKGGSWHVEGTINEDIVATILYYYDTENIGESRLSFRTTFEDPVYEQNDKFYCNHFYGMENDCIMSRNLGSVECKEDRLLIFPNIFQHHVDPFELVDKSKPGHRKILCMFLVDPYNDLVKTTYQVPPQQPDWQDLVDGEIKEKIRNLGTQWPIPLEEMKTVREDLMEERSIKDLYDDLIPPFNREFSLCEH